MKPARILAVVAFVAALGLLAPSYAQAAEAELHVAGSLTSATRTNESLTWSARYILAFEDAVDFRGGVLRFALPLPEGEVLEPSSDLVPVFEEGRLAAIYVAPAALRSRTVDARFVQKATAGRPFVFGAPVAAGSVVQIVDGELGEGASLSVAETSAFEKYVGFVAPRAIGHDAREEARRLTGYTPRVTGIPIFVRGDDVRAFGGLRGHIETPQARARGTFVAVAAVFGLLVATLAWIARYLRHAASVERADALLAAEIENEAR